MKQRIVLLCLLLALLASGIGPQTAQAAVTPTVVSYQFINANNYKIVLSDTDTLEDFSAVLCDGSVVDSAVGFPTDGVVVGIGGAPIKFITTRWTLLGEVTHYSDFCPDSGPSEPTVPNQHKQSASTDEGGTLTLPSPKNGGVNFAAGTCAVKCTITPSLPDGTASNLPGDAIATLYMRLGEGGAGSYSVCFDVGELTNPVIYRYVGGAWVAQAATFSGGQVCTSASGDGAFALGGS